MADEGHLQVIEAMMVAMLLLGAAYFVINFKIPTSTKDRTRGELGSVVTDSLTVLSGLRSSRGNELDAEVVDALQGDATSLSNRIGSYLPTGAGYAILLDNGLSLREIYRLGAPVGEQVAEGVSFAPDWNLTFVQTELSCYEPTMDVNATLVPIYHAVVTNVSAANAKPTTGATVTGVRSFAIPLAWNATLSAATRPASGDVTASIVAKRGTLAGTTTYASCALGGNGPAIVNALRSATLVDAPTAAGQPMRFDVDTTALQNLPGVTLSNASLSIYDPLPLVAGPSGGYVLDQTLTLPTGSPTASATWDVPATSLYGAHPVVLRANLTVAGATVQARVVGIAQVALANGVVPLDPPYRLTIQAWLRDWR